MREGVWKINWTQRAPRQSQDIRDHPELWERVKDMLADLLQFSHDNVSIIHPFIFVLDLQLADVASRCRCLR
jgi:hypothetical protein